MTSYRRIRFGFDGAYRGALLTFIGWPMVGMLTLGILWPRSLWEQARYVLANARYGTERARFVASRRLLYRFCFATLGLGAVLYMGAFTAVAVLDWASGIEDEGMQEETAIALAGGIAFLLVHVVLSAYFRTSYVNASFGGLEIGTHRVESTLATWPLCGIYLSNFALVVLTLGLYAPWATVRQMQYQLAKVRVLAQGDLDQFASAASDGTDAIGEEAGDFFDIDFGL